MLPEHSRSITHILSLGQPLAGSGKADVEPLLEHSRGASPPSGEGAPGGAADPSGAPAFERTPRHSIARAPRGCGGFPPLKGGGAGEP